GISAAGLERDAGGRDPPGALARRGPRQCAEGRARRRILPRAAGLGRATMTELPRSIRDASELLRARKVGALELAELALDRSHRDRHNAWLHLSDDHARDQARAADARLRAGDAPLLTGIPWACKDIIGTKKIPTTAGSRILEGYVPGYSATAAERPDAEGAGLLGKARADGLAMGSSDESTACAAGTTPRWAAAVP